MTDPSSPPSSLPSSPTSSAASTASPTATPPISTSATTAVAHAGAGTSAPTHRRSPVACMVLTALVLLASLSGRHGFFSTLDARLPGWATGAVYPQPQFDYVWKEAQHQATLASGGLSLEALGRDHHAWRILTVNLSSRECQYFYPSQPAPWMLAIFVLIFIWLSVNIYEMILGSLRTAGLLLAVALGSGVVASFYHAGFAYPGLLPFFPALSLAFLVGSFRWSQANRHVGEPYFIPLDLLVVAIQCFLCYWFLADFQFVMIPAIAGGALTGAAYLYCISPTPRHRVEGVKFDRRLRWAMGGLIAVLVVGVAWSFFDSSAHYADPALRAARLGFGPQDQIIIGYDEQGAIHIATGGPALPGGPKGAASPAGGSTNPTGATQANGGATQPGQPGPGIPNPQPQPMQPVPHTVDPEQQRAVYDFDTQLARPYYLARMECVTQLKVAGWPSEMQIVLKELQLVENFRSAAAPVIDFKSELPDLQSYATTLQAEYQAYSDWLAKIGLAADDNLVTRTSIKAALKKAIDLTDRRRKEYIALAHTFAIKTASADLQIGIPLFKPTTVYQRAEEFRGLYENKIGVVDDEIGKWLNRLEEYRQTPVEMKKWIESKNYIDQLKELRTDVEKYPVQDARIREYHQAFLTEAQGLIDYFEFVRTHSVNNDRTTWRGIEDQFSDWLGTQAKRRAFETTLVERFNFTNE